MNRFNTFFLFSFRLSPFTTPAVWLLKNVHRGHRSNWLLPKIAHRGHRSNWLLPKIAHRAIALTGSSLKLPTGQFLNGRPFNGRPFNGRPSTPYSILPTLYSLLFNRQTEIKRRPFPLFTLCPHFPAMTVNDTLNDSEPNACAFKIIGFM